MNKDGELDDNEMRTLGVHLYGAPLKQPSFDELKVCTTKTIDQSHLTIFQERLVNTCLSLQTQEGGWVQPSHEDDGSLLDSSDSKAIHCPITLNVVEHDNKTSEEIKKVFSKKTKYRHQIEGTDEVAFLMIGNNDTVVQGKLDGIRTKRQKFVSYLLGRATQTQTHEIIVHHSSVLLDMPEWQHEPFQLWYDGGSEGITRPVHSPGAPAVLLRARPRRAKRIPLHRW